MAFRIIKKEKQTCIWTSIVYYLHLNQFCLLFTSEPVLFTIYIWTSIVYYLHLNQYCLLFWNTSVTSVVQCRDTIRKNIDGLSWRSRTDDLSMMFVLQFKATKWLTPQPADLYLVTCFKPVPCSLKNRPSKSCKSVQEENLFLFNSQQVKGVPRLSSLIFKIFCGINLSI